MLTTPKLIALLVGGVFVVGSGVIIYQGRPVMKLAQNQNVPTETAVAPSQPAVNESEDEEEAEFEDDDDTVATAPVAPAPKPTPAPAPAPAKGTYTMADVQAHATTSSCWATINGNVYDLTEWVNRHPGGPEKIIGLCGKDGTTKFNNKHGTFQKAIDALILLKIGVLAN